MPLAITTYLVDTPSLRSPLYYCTWGLYYASYALSPGLITVLQLLVLALTWGLPRLEVATANFRVRVAHSVWATERFRDEFVDPTLPPAEWPGWLKATGSALDVRWVGSSAWAGLSGLLKTLGGYVGLGGGGSAVPVSSFPPVQADTFAAPAAFSPRPLSHRSATMPTFAPSIGHSALFDQGDGRASSFRSIPLEPVGGSLSLESLYTAR
ncbi:hypothetical protein JCM10213_003782 [Rhodosporidiobolus nylandii]